MGYAQKKNQQLYQSINQEIFEADSAVFTNAKAYGDYSTAIMALYYLLEHNPDKTNYRDSLAYMYFLSKDYETCIQVCATILKKEPDAYAALLWTGYSHMTLGNTKEAVDFYEKLYVLDPNINFLFQISEFQYLLRRYGECIETIKKVLEHPKIEESTIFMHISEK